MAFHVPDDPFLKDADADGAARFCRDLLERQMRKRYRDADFSPAIGWSARWAAHWAQRSKLWKTLAQ